MPFLHRGRTGRRPDDARSTARCSTPAMPLVQERMNKLAEAADMLGFLFVDEDEFAATPTTSPRC